MVSWVAKMRGAGDVSARELSAVEPKGRDYAQLDEILSRVFKD